MSDAMDEKPQDASPPFVYPSGVLTDLKQMWKKHPFLPAEGGAELPADDHLLTFINVAYHASFLTEEGRRLGFRLAFLPHNKFRKDSRRRGKPSAGATPISFDAPREFSVAEILRLAPATDLNKMLICVESTADNQQLVIWGMLDVGTSWYNFVTGQAEHGTLPPDALTLSSVNPGDITFSRLGFIMFSLRQGHIVKPAEGALSTGPVSDFFAVGRKQLYDDVLEAIQAERWADPHGDEDYPKHFHARFLERLLFHVRQRFHGGTLIFVRDEITLTDSRLTDRIAVKYPAQYDRAWEWLMAALVSHKKYYSLYFKLNDVKSSVSRPKYFEIQTLQDQLESAENAITEAVTALAALSGVDGAVVLTDKYRLLGFGAEVIAVSPTLRTICVASDAGATTNRPRAIEAYGTRHRSAFRFCSSYEDSVAFVISQDGGVKAVKRHGADVIMWPDINFGPLGY